MTRHRIYPLTPETQICDPTLTPKAHSGECGAPCVVTIWPAIVASLDSAKKGQLWSSARGGG